MLFIVLTWMSPLSFRSIRLGTAKKTYVFSICVFGVFGEFFVCLFVKCKQTIESSNQNLYANLGFNPEVSTKFQLNQISHGWENPSFVRPDRQTHDFRKACKTIVRFGANAPLWLSPPSLSLSLLWSTPSLAASLANLRHPHCVLCT